MKNKDTKINTNAETTGITTTDIKTEVEQVIKSGSLNESPADLILKKYAYLQITDSTPIPPPNVIFRINDEIISTEGNVTTISGASKSGKSAFMSVPIAGAIAQGEYDGFHGMYIAPSNGKAVIHIDTEQARHKHQKNHISILRRAGLKKCPDNFLSYNIRQEDLENYITITKQLLNAAYEKFNGIHLIVIDGGADYIRDVNEPKQSNEIVKFFEEMAIKYCTTVFVIVHVNPGSDKERGHLGSQLQRKSESVLLIKTLGDISCLEPKFLRMAGKGDIPLMQFMYDKEKGYHVYCGVKPMTDPSQKDQARIEDIKLIAKKVFAPPASFAYPDAIEKIMKHANKGIVTAKGLFKEMRVHEMIIKGEDHNWRIKIDKE